MSIISGCINLLNMSFLHAALHVSNAVHRCSREPRPGGTVKLNSQQIQIYTWKKCLCITVIMCDLILDITQNSTILLNFWPCIRKREMAL